MSVDRFFVLAVALGLIARLLGVFFFFGPTIGTDYLDILLPAQLSVFEGQKLEPSSNFFSQTLVSAGIAAAHFFGLLSPLNQLRWVQGLFALFSMLAPLGVFYYYRHVGAQISKAKVSLALLCGSPLFIWMSLQPRAEGLLVTLVALGLGWIRWGRKERRSLFIYGSFSLALAGWIWPPVYLLFGIVWVLMVKDRHFRPLWLSLSVALSMAFLGAMLRHHYLGQVFEVEELFSQSKHWEWPLAMAVLLLFLPFSLILGRRLLLLAKNYEVVFGGWLLFWLLSFVTMTLSHLFVLFTLSGFVMALMLDEASKSALITKWFLRPWFVFQFLLSLILYGVHPGADVFEPMAQESAQGAPYLFLDLDDERESPSIDFYLKAPHVLKKVKVDQFTTFQIDEAFEQQAPLGAVIVMTRNTELIPFLRSLSRLGTGQTECEEVRSHGGWLRESLTRFFSARSLKPLGFEEYLKTGKSILCRPSASS